MVKPGGTGKPIRVISARLAPLPPRSGFMEPSPSAFLLPKRYTYFAAFEALAINQIFRFKCRCSWELPGNRAGDFNKEALCVNGNRAPEREHVSRILTAPGIEDSIFPRCTLADL